MPDFTSGAIGISSLLGAKSAKDAAGAQKDAAGADIAFQKETRDIIRGDLSGYRDAGTNALDAYLYELGLGPAPTLGASAPSVEAFTETQQAPLLQGGSDIKGWAKPATQSIQKWRVNGQVFNSEAEAQAYANANKTGGQAYGGFQKTPGYDYRLQTGQDAIEASVAARGGLNSGAAMKALQENGQNFATSEYNNYLSRLTGLTDTGMSAAQMSGQASTNAASGVSNALGNIGNAGAAGAIGVGNSIQNGIGNALGMWNYQKQLGGNGVAGTGLW